MIREWLHWLWTNEDGFFGIGQGPSGRQFEQYGLLSGAEKFGFGEGEKDILSADAFNQALLSGDPAKLSQVLGPLFSTANKQSQERMKTASEFGNRGGGTNAAMQTINESTLGDIRGAIANLTGNAASNLASTGSGLLSAGISAGGAAASEADLMQHESAAKWNDIFASIGNIAKLFGGLKGIKGTTTGDVLSGVGGVLQS